MTGTRSSGILLYRWAGKTGHDLEVLIAHMGGPFWAKRDDGAWSIPKGEHGPDEDPEHAARREFAEETGRPVPARDLVLLGDVRQRGGKVVTAWAGESDFDPDSIRPGTFTMQWPPGSGRMRVFAEIDRVAWVDLPTARHKLVGAQTEFLDRLVRILDEP